MRTKIFIQMRIRKKRVTRLISRFFMSGAKSKNLSKLWRKKYLFTRSPMRSPKYTRSGGPLYIFSHKSHLSYYFQLFSNDLQPVTILNAANTAWGSNTTEKVLLMLRSLKFNTWCKAWISWIDVFMTSFYYFKMWESSNNIGSFVVSRNRVVILFYDSFHSISMSSRSFWVDRELWSKFGDCVSLNVSKQEFY